MILWEKSEIPIFLQNKPKNALEKAEKEYKKYQVKTLSAVEEDYLDTIKDLQKKVEKRSNKKNN